MRVLGCAVRIGLAVALSLNALATDALASRVDTVPEINPTSISAGLAILAGGVLMLRARRNRK